MAEIKRRTSSRKAKAKSAGGQKTLFDLFIPNKPSITNQVDQPQDTEREPLHELPNTLPEDGADQQDVVIIDLETPSTRSLTPPASSHVQSDFQAHAPPEQATHVPPKDLFPLFAPKYKPPKSVSSRSRPHLSFSGSEAPEVTDVDTLPPSRPRRGTRRLRTFPSAPVASSSKRIVDLTVDEGAENTPIVIESSPVREWNPMLRVTGLPRPSRPPDSPAKVRRLRQERKELDAPLPDSTTQHVRGPQLLHLSSEHLFHERDKGKRPEWHHDGSEISLKFLEGASDWPIVAPQGRRSTATNNGPVFDTVDSPQPAGPSLGFVSETEDEDSAQSYWNEKWRPRCADQVLGNEESARYLRDWMHALRLHFAKPAEPPATGSQKSSQKRKFGSQSKAGQKRGAGKGPAIIREVTRPRKRRRGEFEWMVDDDDDDEAGEEFMDPEVEVDPFGDKIHNTILLAGPSGSGKTAAVYACAEELGWNVFEVYPGIGKRGGTNLDSLVGDVGKNHTLPQPRQRAKGHFSRDVSAELQLGGDVFGSFLRPKNVEEAPSDIDIVEGSASPLQFPNGDQEDQGTQPQSNSIVLLEEVDVVFGDEAGFWPAIISLIKSCKRPVVLTCNDISLVPIHDLPLQNTIVFTPPNASLVSSLLLTQANDRDVDAAFYNISTVSAGPAEYPSIAVDLRQSIHQYQIGIPISDNPAFERPTDSAEDVHTWLEATTKHTAGEPIKNGLTLDRNEELRELQALSRNVDSVSYLDAYLILHQPFDFELPEGHPDDEVGYRTLRAEGCLSLPVLPEHYVQDAFIAKAVLVSSATLQDGSLTSVAWMSRGMHAQQRNYQSRLREGLNGFAPEQAIEQWLPSLPLDYGPWLRYMVAVEKREKERQEASRPKTTYGRLTQNSQRTQQDEGWLNVPQAGIEALEKTSLF